MHSYPLALSSTVNQRLLWKILKIWPVQWCSEPSEFAAAKSFLALASPCCAIRILGLSIDRNTIHRVWIPQVSNSFSTVSEAVRTYAMNPPAVPTLLQILPPEVYQTSDIPFSPRSTVSNPVSAHPPQPLQLSNLLSDITALEPRRMLVYHTVREKIHHTYPPPD